MKTSKNTWMAVLALAGTLSWQPQVLGAGQDKPAAGQRLAQFRERMQDMAKELNLTEEQKAKLKPVFQAQMEKLRELRQDTNLSPQEKMEQFKALREEAEPKLKQVLTAGQFEQWKKLAKRRQARSQPK